MNYRYMRLVVFFDLPVLTAKNRRDYRQFRKMLIKNGFIMDQESVYSKLVPNNTMAKLSADIVRKNKPPEGLVQLLMVTEKQYSKMEYIVGKKDSEIIDDDKRLIIL